MDPPAHAVVLSVDDKSQIQPLECTRPDRPLAPGHSAAQTHDYTPSQDYTVCRPRRPGGHRARPLHTAALER